MADSTVADEALGLGFLARTTTWFLAYPLTWFCLSLSSLQPRPVDVELELKWLSSSV